MKKLIVLLLLLFVVSFLPSCVVTAKPIYSLSTVDNNLDKLWLSGREYVKLENKNIRLVIAYDEVENGIVSFDVEILNKTKRTIVVSNGLFSLLNLNKDKKLMKYNSEVLAINPEQTLLNIKYLLSQEEARYEEEENGKALSGIFDLATDIAQDVSEKDRDKRNQNMRDRNERDRDNRAEDISDENKHKKIKSILISEKSRWSFAALRRTTLFPNYKVKGKIYFKLNPKSSYIKVIFYKRRENLEVLYKVSVYKPMYQTR